MKLVNHSPDTVKRQDEHGRWIVLRPGESFEIDDTQGKYLKKAEARIWKQKRTPKGGDE